MFPKTEVLILVDNDTDTNGLVTEHGLSMWVTAGGKHILFDTGTGTALKNNAEALGVDLRQTDAVVLSHGHYDHTGGLSSVFECGVSPKIFMHPDATKTRYAYRDIQPHKALGMPKDIVEALSTRSKEIVYTTQPVKVADGLWVTGPIPRQSAFEDTGGPYFMDDQCAVKDPINDDQALWMETSEGIVVLLGCAHSGVINTLNYISQLTGKSRFCALLGGMHLLYASSERIKCSLDALERYQLPSLAPCHCTGKISLSTLAERFASQFARVGAGSRFTWA